MGHFDPVGSDHKQRLRAVHLNHMDCAGVGLVCGV